MLYGSYCCATKWKLCRIIERNLVSIYFSKGEMIIPSWTPYKNGGFELSKFSQKGGGGGEGGFRIWGIGKVEVLFLKKGDH